jgi:hypothetical protein
MRHEMQGYQSPEDAAMVGFPKKYRRVVATRTEGDDAYVLLDTGPVGRPYLYGVNCFRKDEQWHEGNSGNGGGWSLTDEEAGLGTWSLWNEAPPGADMVRVEFASQVSEHHISGGVYLVVWWRQPVDVQPRVAAIRAKGQWIELPVWYSL